MSLALLLKRGFRSARNGSVSVLIDSGRRGCEPAGHRPFPADRRKTGSNHHVIVDAHGVPLATITTGGNRNDVTQLIPLIEAIPPIRDKRGQPLRRPKHLYADRGYDHKPYRDQVRRFEITPHIARRGIEQGSGLGVYRWVVEGALRLMAR
jgi:transposase